MTCYFYTYKGNSRSKIAICSNFGIRKQQYLICVFSDTLSACDSVHWGVNCNQTCDCTQNSLSCDSIFGCRCKAGWTGTHCEVNVNECQDGGPCKALENCVDTQGSYVCQCKDGYQRNDATGECKSRSLLLNKMLLFFC